MSAAGPIIVGPGQTRHADGQSLVVADEVQCKVRTSDLGGRLCIVLANHAPWEGPPLHAHRDSDEWFFVLKGEFVYEVGGKLYRVVEGSSVVAPQKIPHRYINGSTPGILFIGLTPGGGLEEFFEEGARRRRNPGPLVPIHEELVALYAKYNVDYIGGSLTEDDFKNATS